MENFFTELSSIITDDFFGGIIAFVENLFESFEDLLSSTGEGSSDDADGSSK